MRPSRKPRGPTSTFEPNRAILFAVDPGGMSGWACMDGSVKRRDGGFGELVFSGRGSRPSWAAAIVRAVEVAEERELPLVALLEVATAGPRDRDKRMNPRTLMGMAVNRERWNAEFVSRGITPINVNVARWRSGLFGRSFGRGRDQYKSMAILRARMLGGATLDHNEAEAVCLAAWGVYSGDVALVLK